MKKSVLVIAAVFAAAPLLMAQSLAMPDAATGTQEDIQTENQEAQQPTTPAVEPKYLTPSKSYKAERNAIRSGNDYFNKQQFHEALEAYDKALQVNGGSIRARYNKAVTLLQLQSDDNKGTSNDPRLLAGKILEELIADAREYDTDIAEKSFYNLGNMAFNDEKYDQSIKFYKDALRINPDNMETRENLRLAQLKKQEQEQNQDQDKQDQNKDEEKQDKQEQQQEQQDQQQQQQQQQQPMTQSAQQILQSMQNKENQTRKKVNEEEQPARRYNTDKPW